MLLHIETVTLHLSVFAEGDTDRVVGCAAFVVGDEMAYLASGASTSDPQVLFLKQKQETRVDNRN